jgi:hypothetical protein
MIAARDYREGFLPYAFRPHREGRLLRGRDGAVKGVVVYDAGLDDRRLLLRTVANAICGICRYQEWE